MNEIDIKIIGEKAVFFSAAGRLAEINLKTCLDAMGEIDAASAVRRAQRIIIRNRMLVPAFFTILLQKLQNEIEKTYPDGRISCS